MAHPYQRYTNEQLQEEKKLLYKKMKEAEKMGKKSHVAINQRKIEIVRSYMLDLNQFNQGDIYELKGKSDQLFKIDEMSGVSAWGNRLDKETFEVISRVEALLVDYLGKKIQ